MIEEVKYRSKNENEYTIKGNHAKLFVATKAFQIWMDERLNPLIQMDYIEIRDAFIVNNGKIMLFATVLGVNAKLNGKPINSFAFLRSDAVAMFTIIEELETGDIYTVITEQIRFPYGNILFECPAGMLDDQGFKGAAAKEIEEELHETAIAERLIHLGTTVMSGGGCSERMHYVVFKIKKSKKEIEAIKGRRTGQLSENEDIVLHVLPFNTNHELILALRQLNTDLDAKMLSAITLWRDMTRGGRL